MNNTVASSINYTLEEVMERLHCAKEKANKLIAELDARGIGLIETNRQGLGRVNIIYVKDFSSSYVTNIGFSNIGQDR
jgi:hypothetical protein